MKRLTRIDEHGEPVFVDGPYFCPNEVCARLCAYEDTGLEPEEIKDTADMLHSYRHICCGRTPDQIREVVQADKDGRLVVLPCKVGDNVWFIKFMFSYSKQPIHAVVCRMKSFSNQCTFTFTALTDDNNTSRSFTNYDIGKTVFLTREEAEKALEEAQK